MFNVTQVIKSKHFLITIGNLVEIHGYTIIANAYGPHSLIEKMKLWDNLMGIKNEYSVLGFYWEISMLMEN